MFKYYLNSIVFSLFWERGQSLKMEKKVLLIGIDGMKTNVCEESAKRDESGFKKM